MGMGNTSLLAACFVTYALAYAGMTALCLAMEKHYVQAMRGADLPAGRKKCLKVMGWSLLALGILSSIHGWNPTIGIVVWSGFVSVAAISVVLVLSYFPTQVVQIGASALVMGLLSLLALMLG